MKKHNVKILLAALLVLALSLSMISCSKKKPQSETPTNSLETPTYLNSDPSGEAPTDKPAENQTDKTNETPTQASTEAPTEPEPSLEYKSFGNGTCSVVGIGDTTDLYVVIPEKSPAGDIVTTIEPGAFKGNKDITVVQIPSTVFSIGELAFADCKKLVHIDVDSQNSHFCDIDGVLFDIAQTRLICYPGAKASTSLLLPSTITKIDNMALYGCDSLKVIKFEGTVEQWAAISMGEKNYGIYTASLIFS